jgi:competence protein ComEC
VLAKASKSETSIVGRIDQKEPLLRNEVARRPMQVQMQFLSLLAWIVEPGLQFVDVGQGSALLIVEPKGHAIMIDSGPSAGAEAVGAALGRHDVESVSLWVHTHFDADHVSGFARIVAGEDGAWPTADDVIVERAWDRGFEQAPRTDGVMLYGLLAAGVRQDVSGGAETRIGDASIRSIVLTRAGTDENQRGLALCVELPGLRLLAPGDLPAAQVLEAASACGPVDVLWVSHHGASDGISQQVVDACDPKIAVISAGWENSYCHPNRVTLNLLHAREVWITQAAGLGPRGACEPIVAQLGPKHVVVGGDLWLPLHGG